MALLVCFRESGTALDWSNKAIYLDQSFYELLLNQLKDQNADSPLRRMVMMGYDDELIFAERQLVELLQNLERLMKDGQIRHSQIPSLADVVREALFRKRELLIGGDMYPDLSNPR